ncbi:cellulase family glycosylhydrolase [Paraburkholderia sediminicola]|uniref:cellulase family glycosylhydrolase n=1 Tax=Paraburkholderia sediminicola TaxID=458836 RepID=UPI0038B892EC
MGTQVKVERFTSATATQVKSAGFDFVRFGVWVNAMQTAAYQKRIGAAFAAAQEADLPVLVTVRSTIPLVPPSSNESDRNAQLRDVAKQLTSVVRSLVSAYGNNVLAIELWNEPDLATYWPTGNSDTTFPIYMQAVCAGLKPIHRSVPVVGFGFARAPARGSQSDKLLESIRASSAHCIDAVSYHAYGMSELQIQHASKYIRSRYGLPALITEWGISSGGKEGLTGQAAHINSFLMGRESLNTPLISIYEWQDSVNGKNARERNFGLLDALGTRKPAFGAALTALHSR